MPSSNENSRKIIGVGAATSGITLPNGGVFPVRQVHTKEVSVVKHRVEIPGILYNFTASAGGAADAQGQKILTLPQGKWMVLASRLDLSGITTGTYNATGAKVGLGTVTGVDADAALTTTEADVLASQTFGDGTIAAATAETHQAYVLGTGTAPALVGSTTADTDIFLNFSGTWLHATLTAATLAVTGSVELFLLDLGDI